MEELNPLLFAADAVAFVSPVYYYTVSAQIKAAIDRFYANDAALYKGKKAVLITAMTDDTMESAEGPNATFKGMFDFLEWENSGILNAAACSTAADLENTEYPKMAYEMGKSL